ncbi:glycosyltransferase [Candidatus Pelagibacter ubique]|nr:glycosyltransferase [Candidatus Pelagibacter ubique]
MKISIITVTFNSIKYIKDCLASVSEQSHLDIEHIVIDGDSNDGTLLFLQSKHKQLAATISEPDRGVYDAMNKGIRIAKGDIIVFLNSDDIYASNSVLSSVEKEFIEDPYLEACYSDLIYVDAKDISKIKRYVKPGSFHFGAFSRGWCPPPPNIFC